LYIINFNLLQTKGPKVTIRRFAEIFNVPEIRRTPLQAAYPAGQENCSNAWLAPMAPSLSEALSVPEINAEQRLMRFNSNG
jgi:hypothetical protein